VLTVRLLPEDELAGVVDPERCVELALPRRTEDTITVRALRLTPADLVRLRIATDLAPAEMRTEAAWRQRLAQWHADGRAARCAAVRCSEVPVSTPPRTHERSRLRSVNFLDERSTCSPADLSNERENELTKWRMRATLRHAYCTAWLF
jgi:hypothetical protein